jgi:DNA-directed RNA polymerase specialized sigma24 family protein
MTDDTLDEIRRLADPAERARRATELLAVYQRHSAELGRLRREAIEELHTSGLSYAEVAMAIGISKGRVGQIKQAPPPPDDH